MPEPPLPPTGCPQDPPLRPIAPKRLPEQLQTTDEYDVEIDILLENHFGEVFQPRHTGSVRTHARVVVKELVGDWLAFPDIAANRAQPPKGLARIVARIKHTIEETNCVARPANGDATWANANLGQIRLVRPTNANAAARMNRAKFTGTPHMCHRWQVPKFVR